jgi:hypothetical protein
MQSFNPEKPEMRWSSAVCKGGDTKEWCAGRFHLIGLLEHA